MSSSISPLMHNTIADSIFSNILSKSSKYYYFLGKTNPYNIVDGIEHIEDSVSNYKYELSTRRDIINLKQITNNDVCFVVPRINWNLNTVYDYYDDNYSATYLAHSGATSINDAQFYVMTDEYNVYICLDNNNNSASLVKPTGYDTDPFVVDGYKWKFVMNVPSALRVKFLTSFYIPVTTAINSFYYNNGAIDTVIIDNAGSGYPSNTSASITITGAGTGAVLKPRVSTVNGSIFKVDIISGGTGYVSGSTTLTVVGTGTAMGGVALSTALLEPVVVGGIITHVSITDPGINYNQNSTTLTVQSDTGIGAQLSAIVENGQIIDVIVDNQGSSYRSATITAFGTGGSGAKLTASTTGGQLETIQANVELLTVNGTIDHIQVETQGFGYDSISISIDGDGTGATAEAIIVNRRLVKINILTRGTDYNYATVNIIASGSVPTSLASARAVISPKYGHGKNAITQLFSNTLMLYSTISNTNAAGFDFNNDYRQFGIIKNPTQYESVLLYSEMIGTACFTVKGTVSNGSLVEDMILIDGSSNQYTVISVTLLSGSLVTVLLQANNNTVPLVGQALHNGLITLVLSDVVSPSIDKYSGDMLYIDNRAAFYQTADQTVTLQTILKF